MFLVVRRGEYNTGTILAGTNAIAGALGSTLLPGDQILLGYTQMRYGVVNAAGDAVVIAKA